MRWILISLFVALSSMSCSVAPVAEQALTEKPLAAVKKSSQGNFLWRLSGAETELHILGSIHLGKASLYPLNPAAEAAFIKAEYLGLEIDMNPLNIGKVQAFIGQKGLYGPGESLADDFSAAELEKIAQWLASSELPKAQWMKMRPWLLFLLTSQLNAQQAGLEERYGIDAHFQKKAVKAGKTIVELETAEAQMQMLSSLPDMKKMLLQGCSLSAAEGQKELLALMECIKIGDDEALLEVLRESKELSPAAHAKMLSERNVGMVDKIELWLTQKKSTFVIMGAAHTLGSDGVIELLRKKGYKLERL